MQNFVAPELASPLTVVACDAGATNLILGWLRRRPNIELRTCLAGPAVDLWAAAFGKPKILPLTEALLDAAVLLSGTSYASDLEHQARSLANANGIFSIGVIDHWVNYPDRFLRAGHQVLPDEIWVTDEYALSIALSHFSETTVRMQNNLFLADQVSEVLATGGDLNRQITRRVLYVFEPIRHAWSASGPAGEMQAFDFFMRNTWRLGLEKTVEIRLRPHPSDPPEKYDILMTQYFDWNLQVDSTSSLAQSIAWADTVVGCETYAMVVALAADRYVVSSLPPKAPRCRLPHRSIVHLRDLEVSNPT